MIYGRMILINTTYYNKILDIDNNSYFVSLNDPQASFIKIKNIILDKKMYIYNYSVIDISSTNLTDIIDLDTILSYTPFVKGLDLRKKYYKKKPNETILVSHQAGILNFD